MDTYPNELLIHALSYLDYTSIARSRQVCKRWNEVVESSLLLNYLIELGREDLIDGNMTEFTAKSRQRALRDHRRAWRNLEPTSTDTFTRDTKHLYEASGSIFAWGTGDDPHPSLSFYEARSDILDRPTRFWDLKQLGTPFRDFSMSQEEDLLALIQEIELGSSAEATHGASPPTVKIHLRSLYTGAPHPLASNPILYLYETATPSHSIKSQIMGDTIGIMFSQWGDFPTLLGVWKWTTGEMLSCSAFSDYADAVSFTFVSDHSFVVPLHDHEHGPCLHYYNFEPDDSSIRLAGVFTYVPRLDAIFSLPLDEDVSVVGTFGLEIESEAPVLCYQPSSSRRASITRHSPPPRKFHSRHRPPLIAMRFACAYSEEDEDSDQHFLLAVYASAFTDRVPHVGRAVIPWAEWRDSVRLAFDGLGPQTAAHRRNVFECNVFADRIVVIDRQDTTATVRVMDLNPIRLRSAIAKSSHDHGFRSCFDIAIGGSTGPSVVERAPYDSDRWIELASRGYGRGVGMPFIEVTMPQVFSLMSGAIILEEHLLVMTRVEEGGEDDSVIHVFKM